MPAQSSGAAPARFEIGRDAQNKTFIHDDAVGVAAVGDRRRLCLSGEP